MWKREWSIPYSITNSGLLQNIRSMQDDPPLKKWVGLSINWEYPAVDVKASNSLPTLVVMSPDHQLEDLALKSPINTWQNGDNASTLFKVKFRFWLYASNSSVVWLGDL